MPSTPEHLPTATLHISDETGLARIAARFVASLPNRSFIALEGDLGAGKTTFVKALAAAAGIDPTEVVSPTFGLIHVHEGLSVRLVHADFYRLGSREELRETGWEDALVGQPGRRSWVCVEWPQRIAGLLPSDRLDVTIAVAAETARTLAFTARGPAYEPLIRELAGLPPA